MRTRYTKSINTQIDNQIKRWKQINENSKLNDKLQKTIYKIGKIIVIHIDPRVTIYRQ